MLGTHCVSILSPFYHTCKFAKNLASLARNVEKIAAVFREGERIFTKSCQLIPFRDVSSKVVGCV